MTRLVHDGMDQPEHLELQDKPDNVVHHDHSDPRPSRRGRTPCQAGMVLFLWF